MSNGNCFMDIEIKTWLFDIVTAIQEIESFLTDQPGGASLQSPDIKTKRAIERDFEIIFNRKVAKMPGNAKKFIAELCAFAS